MRNEKITNKGKQMTNQMTNITNEIRNITSISELTELQNFISGYKTLLGKSSIQVGDKVWVVQKTKRTAGVVVKKNIKKAVVEMDFGMPYNVPFSMLELRS
tara:strand:- start:591 stop:893 length:303 start_codon:yes stop_codon:yes gene_type:complete